MHALIRPLAFAATLFAAVLASTGSAAARQDAQAAEAFVQQNAQDVIDSLRAYRSGERDLDVVKAEFRDRIEALTDVERVTNFVLGRYRRTGDVDDIAEFREVFREFAISIYENELTGYAGQTLEVTGSVQRSEDDYIVRSVVRGGENPIEVNWRVLETDDGMRVVDVQVERVWLAQTQREQITSIIGDNNGDVSAATRALRERMQG
jgi:phospholipid transport system substrate-binding protein